MSQRISKQHVVATINLSDGSSVTGKIYLTQSQRPLDMLNDGRAFVPVDSEDGLVVVAKAHIVSVDNIKDERDASKDIPLYVGVR